MRMRRDLLRQPDIRSFAYLMSDEHLDPEYADDELEDIALNEGEILDDSDIPEDDPS